MIKVMVRQAAKRRGIKNPYRLAQRLEKTDDVPSVRAQLLAGTLWNDRNEPRLATIDRVVEALGCELSELLVWKPNTGKKSRTPPSGSRQNGRL